MRICTKIIVLATLFSLFSMGWSQCDHGYTEYDGECYYDDDLNFLTLLIYLNEIEFELFYDIGITIWQNGRINTLFLEGLSIHEVPENIQNLDSLVTLSFSDNELEHLPATIGNLPSLNTLLLSNNLLVDIPEEIGNLSDLEFLHMPGNQLVELPTTISTLSSIISLNIDNNLFTTFPAEIMELSTLRYVYLANNEIHELPSNIGILSSLQILSAYTNNIFHIPSTIGNLSNLYYLDFANNELIGIPENICDIYDNLTVFNINLNNICPPYPHCLDEADLGEQDTSNCLSCDEGYTEISEIPWTVYYDDTNNCFYQSDLDVLQDFIDNSQGGDNPPPNDLTPIELCGQVWISGRLVNLCCSGYDVDQDQCYIDFELNIPESIENLDSLIIFSLEYNQLSGIPESIGNLTNLEGLILHHNQITNLPESIGNLTNLTVLDIDNNQLTTIPESIGNLTSLIRLLLPYNQITSIPDGIGNMTILTDLYLFYNNLTSIPESIGNLISLEQLWLSDNQLTTLPESICDIPYDCNILVQNNQLCEEYHYDCIDGWGEQTTSDCIVIGDINADGTINIIDIVLLANMILGDQYDQIADLNEDLELNILDIVIMVSIILGND